MPFWNRNRKEAAVAADGHRVQVVPDGEDWRVIFTGTFGTQGAAVLIGRFIAAALGLQFDIKGEDGRIRKTDSSGDAPDDPNIPG